jgi:hypothetical protein
MSKALDKHKKRQIAYLLPNADTTLALLLQRTATGEGDFIVPGSREARIALRKAVREKKERENA